MATVDASLVRSAVKKRRSHVIENQEVLTMKQFRKMLEEDLQLEPASLKPHKELIEGLVDQMVSANRAQEAKCQEQPKEKKVKSEKKSKQGKEGSSSGKKSKRKEETGDAPRKKRKQEKEEPAKKAAQGPREDSKAVKKAKNICKQAGIKIPPNIYRNKDEDDLQEAFSSLLEKHDLCMHASSSDIAKAAKKLQKEKDLEGIDTSNIVEGGRRSRPQVNYSAVLKPKYLETIESDSEAESEDGEESSEAGSDSEASDEENVRPKNGKGEIRSDVAAGKKQKKQTAKVDSGADSENSEDSASPDSPQREQASGDDEGLDSEVQTKKGSAKARDAGGPPEDDSAGASKGGEESEDDAAIQGKAKSAKEQQPAYANTPSSHGKPAKGAKTSNPSGSASKGDESEGAGSEEEEEAPQARRTMAAWSDDD